jgi:hypothetical protein
MKKTLATSLVLNLVLFTGIVFLCFRSQRPTVMLMPPVVAQIEAPTTPSVQTEVVSEPFRWSQLLSSNDYRLFVVNLRTAGCPESTVEDIVRGNTARAFSSMRERLRVSPTEPGPWSAQAQMQMVAYFLGQAPTDEAARAANNKSPENQPAGATPPLVFQNVNLSTLKLNKAQTQAIADIRQAFWNSVGGANQNANDPAYLARWQKAQSEADNMLQDMLGEQAFDQYQLQVYQMTLQNQDLSARN